MQLDRSLSRASLCALLLAAPAAARQAVEEAKLVPPDPSTGEWAGDSVAIWGDWAVLGVPRDFIGPLRYGAVHVYRRGASGWLPTQKIRPDFLEEYDTFGHSVSLEGTTLVIGAIGDNDRGLNAGAVYVYERTGASFQLVQTLYGQDTDTGDFFGSAVALEGDTLAVGASFAGGTGAAYVFTRQGGAFVQQAKLLAIDPEGGDNYGNSIALSGDRVVVGALNEDTIGWDGGAIYVYGRTNGAWSFLQKILATDGGVDHRFGWSVAAEGPRVAAGAARDDSQAGDAGSVYVFVEGPGGYALEQKLYASDGELNAEFGRGLAMHGDLLAAAAPQRSGDATLYLFRREASTWVETDTLTPTDVFGTGHFGEAVATDGARVIVGAPQDYIGFYGEAGSGFVYAVPPATSAYCEAKTASNGCVPRVSWSGTPSAGSLDPFEIRATEVPSRQFGVFFYSTSGSAAQPFQGGTLCAAAPLVRTDVQNAGGNPPGLSDCSGVLSIDFNAWIAAEQLAPGTQVNGQFWFRDAADPFGTGLSDAIEFVVLP